VRVKVRRGIRRGIRGTARCGCTVRRCGIFSL